MLNFKVSPFILFEFRTVHELCVLRSYEKMERTLVSNLLLLQTIDDFVALHH